MFNGSINENSMESYYVVKVLTRNNKTNIVKHTNVI